MVAPLIISRADHSISRQHIDPDALRVLYRLRKFNHTAYLVGGGVRDLLLDRHPKDFDIATSAHPHEVKRIFRNCWIIGRRFRLAHVKFGQKTIEVATFRRQVSADEPTSPPDSPGTDARTSQVARRPIRRDNTFGSPEEDAFRRDFTINALFYDIATFAILDYVGGMDDLRNGLIRCIGDPGERFIEDPVRMLRAVSFAARLDFRLDPPVRSAIAQHQGEIANAAPPRLLEELYKILRSGVAAKTFRGLSKSGLLQHIAPEIEKGKSAALWRSLDRLDGYRARFPAAPATLSNPILLGSLVAPVTAIDTRPPRRDDATGDRMVVLGRLPVARRDVERLRLVLAMQPGLADTGLSARARRSIMSRSAFPDALSWMEIQGDDPASRARWTALTGAVDAPKPRTDAKRRRRRRRGGRRRGPAES